MRNGVNAVSTEFNSNNIMKKWLVRSEDMYFWYKPYISKCRRLFYFILYVVFMLRLTIIHVHITNISISELTSTKFLMIRLYAILPINNRVVFENEWEELFHMKMYISTYNIASISL